MWSRKPPSFPADRPTQFRATVHGTIFGDRSAKVAQVHEGDELLLIPGPPLDEEPGVWVHLPGGDLIGHLPPEIEGWLAPWLLRGGTAQARAVRVKGEDCPSWNRLLIEVACERTA
jgi:hypothetical protein